MLIGIFTVITLGYFSISTEACNKGDPDGTGVELLGNYYDCKYLRAYYPEDRYVGIYKNRTPRCRSPLTDCCQTCEQILSCQDAPVNGIYLAEKYYNCSDLRQYHPDDEYVGIYKNRVSVCQQATTDCCETCEKVMEELMNSTTSITAPQTTAPPVRPSAGTATQVQYEDTCQDDCLWIGDGSVGKCSWLLDETSSVYSSRHAQCKGLATGCAKTCHIISMESTKPTESSTTQTESTVTTTLSTVCQDTFMMVKKYSYACSDLLNPKSNIYNNRQQLCSSDINACCVTCERVNNEKLSDVIKDNDKNMINTNVIKIKKLPNAADAKDYQSDVAEPTYNIQISKSTNNAQTTRTTSQSKPRNNILSFYEIIKASAEKMRKEEERRRNVFSIMMANIMSTFKRLQQANN